MNSKINNDLLRTALERRAAMMAPPEGWEERLLAVSRREPRPKRHAIRWIAAIGGVAAALTAAVMIPPQGADKTVMPQPTHMAEKSICHNVAIPDEQVIAAPLKSSQQPTPGKCPDFVVEDIDIDMHITVEEELAALFAMDCRAEEEMVNCITAPFDELNPISITPTIIEPQ